MAFFSGGELLPADLLAEKSGQPVHEVAVLLMQLELKRLIAKRTDGKFKARA